MKIIYRLLFLLSIFLVLSCAYSKAYTIYDPVLPNLHRKNYIVQASIIEREIARNLEMSFCDEMSKYNLYCIAYSSLFSPLKEYNGKEILDKLYDNNIEVIIFIKLLESGTKTVVVGNQYGVSSFEKEHAMYEFEFFDIELESVIFNTQIRTRGNAFANRYLIDMNSIIKAIEEYAIHTNIKKVQSNMK